MKPALHIRAAREKAEEKLRELLPTIEAVCDWFTDETGLAVTSCEIDFMDVSTFGGGKESRPFDVTIEHEDL